jgi:DNA-binding protein H-NS
MTIVYTELTRKDKAPQPLPANGPAAPESKPPPLSAEALAKAEALPVDLATLSDDALSALLAAVERKIAERHAKREADLVASILETAAAFGIPPARIAAKLGRRSAPRPQGSGVTDGRHVVKPKYRCLTDHSLRWSGRGAQPKWYADHLSAGGKPEDMLIPEDEA